MKLTFLGTSSMVPTKERNVQGIYLEYKGEGILIDCGEGTQRQMNIAGISRTKVRKVLITHWHGDHVSGLVGLIQTMGNSENIKPLEIIGPSGTKKHVSHVLKSCVFEVKVDLKVTEINPKPPETIFDTDEYVIKAANLSHTVPCVGYSFIEKDRRRVNLDKTKKLGLTQGPLLGKLQRGLSVKHEGQNISPDNVTRIIKGRKITFLLDTEYCSNCVDLAKDSDVLVCEATFASDLSKKALQYRHLTSEIAARIAVEAGAKKLILTHFSQRYKSVKILENEAKKIFSSTVMAEDFLVVKL